MKNSGLFVILTNSIKYALTTNIKMTPPSSPVTRNAASKSDRILLGSRVSARLGELLTFRPERCVAVDPSAKRNPQRKKAHVFVNFGGVLGKIKYMVHFDNKMEKEMFSNTLKSWDQAASLPPGGALDIAASREADGSNVQASFSEEDDDIVVAMPTLVEVLIATPAVNATATTL
jgi:hypothetical protein